MISATSSGGNPIALLLPFLLLGGLFYFMILRPQQRRSRQQQSLINSVEVGDEILIAGAGIYGTIVEIDDEEGTVSVEVAPGVQLKMLRAGIARRVSADYEEEDEDEDEDEDDDADTAQDEEVPDDDHQDYPDQPGQIKEL
jgi:preprotein translocase, YajC subunit